jgi:hypothetical protein
MRYETIWRGQRALTSFNTFVNCRKKKRNNLCINFKGMRYFSFCLLIEWGSLNVFNRNLMAFIENMRHIIIIKDYYLFSYVNDSKARLSIVFWPNSQTCLDISIRKAGDTKIQSIFQDKQSKSWTLRILRKTFMTVSKNRWTAYLKLICLLTFKFLIVCKYFETERFMLTKLIKVLRSFRKNSSWLINL